MKTKILILFLSILKLTFYTGVFCKKGNLSIQIKKYLKDPDTIGPQFFEIQSKILLSNGAMQVMW